MHKMIFWSVLSEHFDTVLASLWSIFPAQCSFFENSSHFESCTWKHDKATIKQSCTKGETHFKPQLFHDYPWLTFLSVFVFESQQLLNSHPYFNKSGLKNPRRCFVLNMLNGNQYGIRFIATFKYWGLFGQYDHDGESRVSKFTEKKTRPTILFYALCIRLMVWNLRAFRHVALLFVHILYTVIECMIGYYF